MLKILAACSSGPLPAGGPTHLHTVITAVNPAVIGRLNTYRPTNGLVGLIDKPEFESYYFFRLPGTYCSPLNPEKTRL